MQPLYSDQVCLTRLYLQQPPVFPQRNIPKDTPWKIPHEWASYADCDKLADLFTLRNNRRKLSEKHPNNEEHLDPLQETWRSRSKDAYGDRSLSDIEDTLHFSQPKEAYDEDIDIGF